MEKGYHKSTDNQRKRNDNPKRDVQSTDACANSGLDKERETNPEEIHAPVVIRAENGG